MEPGSSGPITTLGRRCSSTSREPVKKARFGRPRPGGHVPVGARRSRSGRRPGLPFHGRHDLACHNPAMSRRHRPGRAATPGLASLAIAAGLALAACGLTAPGPTSSPPNASRPTPGASPSPSAPGGGQPTAAPDNEAVYAAIEAQVVKLRGLQPKSPVEPHVLNKAEIKALVETSFEKDNPDDVVAANERLLK